MDPVLNFDPWFLIPPPEVNNIQHSDYYIKHGENKKIRRKIFENVEYDEFEKKCLVEFKEFVRQNNVQIPEGFKESSYLKMLQAGKYNMKKSLKALTQHVEWINNPKWHTLDQFSTNFLMSGNVYLCGRDKQLRPVIYMDCQNLNLKTHGADQITQAMCVFLEMIKKYMMVPGKVENWIFIIDTREKGIFSLPLKALGVIIDAMQVNFGGCLERLYILNPSFGLKNIWSVIEKMIDEEAASKIKFLDKKQLSQMQNDIEPRYLQKKYQGQLDDLTQFWPPIDIYTTKEQKEERQRKLNPAPVPVVALAAPSATNQIVETKQIQEVQKQDQEISLQPNDRNFIQNNNSNQVKPFSFGGSISAEPLKLDSQDHQQTEQQKAKLNKESTPKVLNNQNRGEGSNKAIDEKMSQSFGNTHFVQSMKASSKRFVEDFKQESSKDQINQSATFQINIQHVENQQIIFDNVNQFNKQDEPQLDINKNIKQTNTATTATTQETKQDFVNTQNSMQSQASPGKKEEQFKEVEKGFVVLQEEEEEGHTVTATDVNQLIKKSKNVFAKQNTTTIKEDKKMVEIEEIGVNQNNKGCCGQNSKCNIF
ncbi:CRAL TRIO domain protein (macronuclear) [Tetrahymena thermophila SB210]|uniref:CRAL TRIO domain protein n=1 Tax=Tetrahymena thermophila (strain SB210) TaxID=312017 RepID=I7M1A8_TETTS|nr:CRAL TRIO domain protein [Tetrahymena thermophila SB210]EAR95968.2 CRAL TRIO domain protein [Tetrahymena thermophila SB210]|eukprot:XP_001016213.2 CRAL TRIO domain protein [Tetrahymena thermophila SB210]